MKKIGKTIRRRRRENKTDYKARFSLIKSNKPRIVVRKTNRYIIGQMIESNIAQDKTLVGVNSKDLLKFNWPSELTGSLKNRTASYLTGYLLGKKSGKKEGILDIGLQKNIKKSRLSSFVKGLKDSGFDINVDEGVLPEDEIFEKNEKTKGILNKVKEALN